MPHVSYTDTTHSKKPATVEVHDLPAGGQLVHVRWPKLHVTLDLAEAARLRDDLTAALTEAGSE